jgi:SAM-dependent methyltransferase
MEGAQRLLTHDNLDAFADADAYDREDPSDTGGPFYRALAQETGGPVLELGCGTGRVTIPIARLGIPVWGLDLVAGMIERARRKSEGLPARWIVGDARSFQLPEQFRLIFLTGNVFQFLLSNVDQGDMLRCAHAHLHADGLLAFETRNPRFTSFATRAAPYEGMFFHLETNAEERGVETYLDTQGRTVHTGYTQTYDPIAQVLHLRGFKRRQEGATQQTTITRTALRYTFPQELAALLHYQGFTLLRQYGDWNLEPLGESSPSIIVVCRRQD